MKKSILFMLALFLAQSVYSDDRYRVYNKLKNYDMPHRVSTGYELGLNADFITVGKLDQTKKGFLFPFRK